MKTLQELTKEAHSRAENTAFAKHLMSGKITKRQYLSYLLAYYPVYVALEKKMVVLIQNGRLVSDNDQYKSVVAELFILNPTSRRIKQDIFELIQQITLEQATAVAVADENATFSNVFAATPSKVFRADENTLITWTPCSGYSENEYETDVFLRIFNDQYREITQALAERGIDDHVPAVIDLVETISNISPVSHEDDIQYLLANVYVRFAADLAGGQMIRKLVPGSGRLYTVSDPSTTRQFLRSLVTPENVEDEKALLSIAETVNQAFAVNTDILNGLVEINQDIPNV